jgi:hypothetical protein
MSNDFYELRLYRVERGRMQDMQARWQQDLAKLFARHGVRPLGAWQAMTGPELPLFVYLMHWPDWQTREAAWGGFYADPEWAEARTRTNRGTELVEGYTLNFLRGILPWNTQATPDHVELWLSQIDIGQSAAAHHAITQSLPEQMEAVGGAVLGAMEFMTGSQLPQAALMLSWPQAHGDPTIEQRLQQAPLGRATRYRLVAL